MCVLAVCPVILWRTKQPFLLPIDSWGRYLHPPSNQSRFKEEPLLSGWDRALLQLNSLHTLAEFVISWPFLKDNDIFTNLGSLPFIIIYSEKWPEKLTNRARVCKLLSTAVLKMKFVSIWGVWQLCRHVQVVTTIGVKSMLKPECRFPYKYIVLYWGGSLQLNKIHTVNEKFNKINNLSQKINCVYVQWRLPWIS